VAEGGVERAAAQHVERALDAVAQAHEVALVVQHVLVDERVGVRVRGREAQPAAPLLLVDPDAQQPGPPGAAPPPRASPRARRVSVARCDVTSGGSASVWLTEAMIMSFSPAPARPDE
jgi:hypothetical protein